MTTIIGIEAKKDRSVILASDLSATRTRWAPQGDVAYRKQTREEAQKINVDNKGYVAVATSGTIDMSYIDFLEKVIAGEINLEEVIKNENFPEFKKLNEDRWQGRVPDDNINSLLMAARYSGESHLYSCWPLGKVDQRPFTAIGSGSEYALEHLTRYGEQIYRGLPLVDCVDLAVSGLQEASRDIYTAGLDLVVVTPDKIHMFGGDIKRAVDTAKRRTINRIKRNFSKLDK